MRHYIVVLLAVLTESEAEIKAYLDLSGNPLCQARYNNGKGLSCIFLDSKLAKIVAQTPGKDVTVRVDECGNFVTDTNLHDFFICTQLLGHYQMLGRVQGRTPYK